MEAKQKAVCRREKTFGLKIIIQGKMAKSVKGQIGQIRSAREWY
jgi:hypothetical protein